MSMFTDKIENHAANLESIAAALDEAGIGQHQTRGHAQVLRHMAASMRCDAAAGRQPHAYIHENNGVKWSGTPTPRL